VDDNRPGAALSGPLSRLYRWLDLGPSSPGHINLACFMDGRVWPLLAGLLIMFGPTFRDLMMGGAWSQPEYSHGPVVFAVSLWLFWRQLKKIPAGLEYKSATISSWICLLLAAAFYIPGRALRLDYIETAAFFWAMTGVVLMIGGKPLFRLLRFPLFFLLLMIPLPNFVMSTLSGVLKPAVAAVAVDMLSWFDLPVARTGVTIAIGQYQLLVADACAGVRNLLMLETLGILYLHLIRSDSITRNIMLPILIVPISFGANVVRVMVLALVTYNLGDSAGQGFLHEFAGLTLFVVGLLLIVGSDSLLRLVNPEHGALGCRA
jgi:exosortase B